MPLSAQYSVVVPAAGVGKRMKADNPKQYLHIAGKTVIEHTLNNLLAHNQIKRVIVALNPSDTLFAHLPVASDPRVDTVIGGQERSDSVLAGLNYLPSNEAWVLVHDAARPCVKHQDLTQLINYCLENDHGGLLAAPVRDTMKQANAEQCVASTLDRSQMWHALTPQMYKTAELTSAITASLASNVAITDESSALEAMGYVSGLVSGSSDNIKITQPEDLSLAEFILNQQAKILSSEAICE